MPDRPYGFAIAGCGVIASHHARAIAGVPNARLRAVADVVAEAAQRCAAEFHVDAYTDLREMLQRPDIDVVAVCVPSGLHASVGIQAAEAGKHVIVEKPIDVSLEAADRLIAACRQRGVKLAVISQHRFDPGIQEVRVALEGGRFGRLILGDVNVKWYRTQHYYRHGGWRGTRELDGGALMNQGVHWVDVLQWMMGPVDRVVGRCATIAHDIPVEDVALALLTFRGGALGMIEVSTAVYPGLPERMEITGTGGTAVVEMGEVRVWEFKDEKGEVGMYGAKVRASSGVQAAPTTDPADRQIAGHQTQITDFLEAIAEDRDPLVTGGEARKVLEIILAVYQSARTGHEIALPLPGAAP
jgi:UDP-N-acetyl-2-amino-2-deoxyglucuronate dehydrogenase